ncbi:MAG: methyltransferase domain-containing protein [bacterium]|nr:methyltransferase domain-containing protein [bacterium]
MILLPIFIISFVLLLAGLFLIFDLYVVVIGHLKGAPYVPSSRKRVMKMLELADLKPGENVVDLGSGDGKILIEAAKLGCFATGLEINPFLVWFSRFRAARRNLSGRIKILRQDFNKYPLREADVVFVYLWPETIDKLSIKFRRELKPEARIVSNAFSMAGTVPLKTSDNVFLYKKDNLKK